MFSEAETTAIFSATGRSLVALYTYQARVVGNEEKCEERSKGAGRGSGSIPHKSPKHVKVCPKHVNV